MKNTLLALLVFLALPALAAKVEDTVATVNGKPILLSEFKRELSNILEQYKQNAPQVVEDAVNREKIRRQVLDDMIDKAILIQEAEKAKVKVFSREQKAGESEVKERFRRDDDGKTLTDAELDAMFAKELARQGLGQAQFEERIKRDLLIRKFINETLRPKVQPPTDEDAKSFFEMVKFAVAGDTAPLAGLAEVQKGELMALARQLRDLTSERVRPRHILIRVSRDAGATERSEALKKIQSIKKELASGREFEELARKHSQDPGSAARGGDLGPVVKGMTVPEFEKAAFALGVGETSDVVESPFGYHLIRVDEKRAPRKLLFDEVKDDLEQFMMGQRLQRAIENKVKELRAAAAIETFLPKDDEAKNSPAGPKPDAKP